MFLASALLSFVVIVLIGSLQHGTCTVVATKHGFSSEELVDMIHRCGLNRLNQFATFLSMHLRGSRQNPKLLQYLQSLDEILYSGLPLEREDEEWAYKKGLKIKVWPPFQVMCRAGSERIPIEPLWKYGVRSYPPFYWRGWPRRPPSSPLARVVV